MLDLAFLIAAFAVEFKTNARVPTFLSPYPMPGGEGRIMTHMLKMPTFERGPPMAFVIFFKPYDALFQIVSAQPMHGS